MKITILLGPFMCLPPHSIGAVEKLWSSVGRDLIKRGENVLFISKNPGKGQSDVNNCYIKGYERSGSKVKDFILDFVYSVKAIKAVQKCDVLIINSHWSAILSRIIKKKCGCLIYSIERFPKGQMGFYKKIGGVTHFRCCSSAVYQALMEQNPELKDCSFIIPNCIDTEIFNNSKNREKGVKEIATVVYAGRIHSEKGLDLLVKAVEKLNTIKDYNLKVRLIGSYDIKAGGSGKEYFDGLCKMAQHTKLEYVDAIYDAAELAKEIAGCDIFCYPSVAERGESFGVSALEAMGLGIPTIVSDLECFKDFIEDGSNGLIFDHRNEKACERLAQKIDVLFTDRELYRSLSINGAITSAAYSVPSIAEKYIVEFERLLNG